MLIKCVKCGFENQLGSIFCRGCGEKIDMDQLSPEVMMEKSKANKANKAKKEMIKNVIALIVFAILSCIVAAVLVPFGQTQYNSVPTETTDISRQKLESVKAAAPGSTVSFTCDELTGLWQGIIADPFGDIEGMTFEPSTVSVAEAPDGKMRVYLFCRVLTSFNVTLFVDCIPSKSEGGDPAYQFDVSFAKMGHLPFFFMQNIVADLFKPVLHPSEISDAFAKAQSVTWEAGELTFQF